jgi:mycothiol synthase
MTRQRTPSGAAALEVPLIPGLSFRAADPGDWDAMADLMNRAHAADGVDERQTGQELAAEHARLDDFDVRRDILVADVDGAILGYGVAYRVVRDGVLAGEMWGSVDPKFRHRGLGTALFEQSRARLAHELADDPRSGPRELRSFAMDLEVSDRALLADRGFAPIRYGFEMRRFLTGVLPERALPDGIEIRPVTPDQHRAIFEADDEAFSDHWGHRAAGEGDFRTMFHGPNVDTSLWCVAWDGDQVAGSVMNGIFALENAELGVRRGWLEHVSVRRAWRGRGVAKALCAASFRVLRERGMDEAWLGVDGANPTGALALYEGLGFHVARRWQAYGRPVDGPAPDGWQSAADGPADGSAAEVDAPR